MPELLATIVEHVRGEVARRRRQVALESLSERPAFHAPTRGFARALSSAGRHVIAEVKRASPSKGLIRSDFDPVAIAREYSAHGASAISVLTEERFFGGSLNYLEQIRSAVSLPLLRKDFIVDSYQLAEARAYGADAILLIAALLDADLMRSLCDQAQALGLDTLVEVHDDDELKRALKAGARLIGINNRDLRTFEVSLRTTETLAPLIPPGILAVCESGIDEARQIRQVEGWGLRVFLIGESLMRAPSPGKKLGELLRS